MSPHLRAERGQITPLLIGFLLVLALLAAVVTDASAAYLRRQGLNSLADGAALAAAEGVRGEQVYDGGLGTEATVDPIVAREYVEEYLRTSGAEADFPELRWSVEVDDDAVRVRLSSRLDLPITPPGWDPDTTVSGEASVVVRVT